MVRDIQYPNIPISLIICLALIFAQGAYGQDSYANRPIQTINGQIAHINWVASNITVRWLQPNGITVYDEITFFVPRKANIMMNGEGITLSDVQIGDNTTVEYVNTNPGPLRAVSISIVK